MPVAWPTRNRPWLGRPRYRDGVSETRPAALRHGRDACGGRALLVNAVDSKQQLRWEELGRSPIRLEWSDLQIDPRSAQEILELLRGPLAIVPEPVHYWADIGLWDGSLRAPGLRVLLQHATHGHPDSVKALADALGSPYSRPSPDKT